MPSLAERQRWLAGYVGRLSSEKGPDLFLDALIPLCHQYPQLDAVMLGDGPERDSLQARIDAAGLQAAHRLPGYQTDMRAWWQQLDALVISSRTEGTPMILLEAMQAGVPVVAFGVGGIPDVIAGPPQRPARRARRRYAALARQIDTLLGDPALAAELTDNARRTQRDATTSGPGRTLVAALHPHCTGGTRMIFPLSIVSLFGLVCLGLLASPYPYLAPGAVLGLVGCRGAVPQARPGACWALPRWCRSKACSRTAHCRDANCSAPRWR